ncbi:MAG: bifunctional aldolase/short-chain dehydrogenase [Phycisphaerae bacterium]
MINRWDERAADEAYQSWAPRFGEALALRIYSARLLGADTALVLHGGGNVSLKGEFRDLLGESREAIWVKGSGHDLATLEPTGLTPLDLAYVRRLRALASLDDAAMVEAFRTHLLSADAPTPSIETLMHAFLPASFVDHSHADALLAITNQPDGAARVREALGPRAAVLEYVPPGFELAKAVVALHERQPAVHGIVLLQHGLVTFGDTARESYDLHIELVDACERFLAKAARRGLTVAFQSNEPPPRLAALAAPLIRGTLARTDDDAPPSRSICEWRGSATVLEFANSAEAKALSATGPLTSDHLIRTKTHPLYVPQPAWSDAVELDRQLRDAVTEFRVEYGRYVAAHGGDAAKLDLSPRVVLLPGAGLLAYGRTRREARIAADVMEHTLAVKRATHAIGEYRSLAAAHLYDMEFRRLQLAKLARDAGRPLERMIVAISGGGGAIGAAIAEKCALAGAHVLIVDLNAERLELVARRIESLCGAGVVETAVADVTDEASVCASFEQACRTLGGVDVIVPNAGAAHVSSLENLSLDDFRRIMRVNADGCLLFLREGARVLRRQGIGGQIVIISSKNVMGPGKDFGAYSASKAAAHQLGKIAAIELAPFDIRVNMVTPDAVFSHEGISSGLWDQIGPSRAASRGMSMQELPEFYRQRNLLRARVLAEHVGNAVVFFASGATPTTGATLPVDGGVVDAFPR